MNARPDSSYRLVPALRSMSQPLLKRGVARHSRHSKGPKPQGQSASCNSMSNEHTFITSFTPSSVRLRDLRHNPLTPPGLPLWHLCEYANSQFSLFHLPNNLPPKSLHL